MDCLCKGAILMSKNDTALEIKEILLHYFQVEWMEYRSVNLVLEVDDAVNYYLIEFLNSLFSLRFTSHLPTFKLVLQ